MMNEIPKRYHINHEIGKGAFAFLMKGLDKKSNRFCAFKFIDKGLINKENKSDYIYNLVKNEISIMKICRCNNVVELYDHFQTKEYFVLVMELCDCNLEEFVNKNKEYQGNLILFKIYLLN